MMLEHHDSVDDLEYNAFQLDGGYFLCGHCIQKVCLIRFVQGHIGIPLEILVWIRDTHVGIESPDICLAQHVHIMRTYVGLDEQIGNIGDVVLDAYRVP